MYFYYIGSISSTIKAEGQIYSFMIFKESSRPFSSREGNLSDFWAEWFLIGSGSRLY